MSLLAVLILTFGGEFVVAVSQSDFYPTGVIADENFEIESNMSIYTASSSHVFVSPKGYITLGNRSNASLPPKTLPWKGPPVVSVCWTEATPENQTLLYHRAYDNETLQKFFNDTALAFPSLTTLTNPYVDVFTWNSTKSFAFQSVIGKGGDHTLVVLLYDSEYETSGSGHSEESESKAFFAGFSDGSQNPNNSWILPRDFRMQTNVPSGSGFTVGKYILDLTQSACSAEQWSNNTYCSANGVCYPDNSEQNCSSTDIICDVSITRFGLQPCGESTLRVTIISVTVAAVTLVILAAVLTSQIVRRRRRKGKGQINQSSCAKGDKKFPASDIVIKNSQDSLGDLGPPPESSATVDGRSWQREATSISSPLSKALSFPRCQPKKPKSNENSGSTLFGPFFPGTKRRSDSAPADSGYDSRIVCKTPTRTRRSLNVSPSLLREAKPQSVTTPAPLNSTPFLNCYWTVGRIEASIEVLQLTFDFPPDCLEEETFLNISLHREEMPPEIKFCDDPVDTSIIFVYTVTPHELKFLKKPVVRVHSKSGEYVYRLWRREPTDNQWCLLGILDSEKGIYLRGFCDLCATKHKAKQEALPNGYKFRQIVVTAKLELGSIAVDLRVLDDLCEDTLDHCIKIERKKGKLCFVDSSELLMTQEGNFRVSICPVATENEEENPWKINGPKERSKPFSSWRLASVRGPFASFHVAPKSPHMELKDAQKKGWPCDIIAKFESASPRHEDTCEFSATFGTVFDNNDNAGPSPPPPPPPPPLASAIKGKTKLEANWMNVTVFQGIVNSAKITHNAESASPKASEPDVNHERRKGTKDDN